MKLYFECYSGISGDMMIGSLLDLGADKQKLTDAISSLKLDGKYELKFARVKKNGIDAYDFDVILEDNAQVDKHDQNHHEHEHTHEHEFVHEYSESNHKYEHFHEHAHNHDENEHSSHEHHHPPHTNTAVINSIIENSDLSDYVKTNAKNIFDIIAEAESKAHGIPKDEVHFHEVGAVDSIIDIVGACVLLEDLGVTDIYFSQIYEGRGFVHCMHGNMPVPVPAVLNICSSHGLKINIIDDIGEHVTPTGAAIIANFSKKTAPQSFTPLKIGLGAGNRDFEKTTNVLRAIQISEDYSDEITVIQTNIDDTTGEVLGYCMEKISKIALDVYYTPIFMKKNRPAYMLSVLCNKEDEKDIEKLIFTHTTSIGLRKHSVKRTVLDRKRDNFEYNGLSLCVKTAYFEGEKFIYPEYDSVKLLCETENLPIMDCYDIIRDAYKRKIGKSIVK